MTTILITIVGTVIVIASFPLMPFIALPWLALLPASLFLVFALKRGGLKACGLVLAAAVWVLYMLYERDLKTQFPPGDPVIRIYLFLIGPIMWMATLLGWWCARRRRAERDATP